MEALAWVKAARSAVGDSTTRAYAGPDRRRTQIGPALLEQPGPGTTA